MSFDKEMIDGLELMARKEAALSQIVAWLKGRGLWEECNRELGITVPSSDRRG